MNNIFAVSAFALFFATSANAFELGNGFAWDTTATATYSVEAEDFAVVLDTELNFEVAEGAVAYITTSFDLEDPVFTGAELGVDWAVPQAEGLNLSAWVDLDENAEYVDATIEASFSF